MKGQPIHNISAERTVDILNSGQQLQDAYISGEVKIVGESAWNNEIIISDCIIEYFEGSVTSFIKPVKFINTHFKDCRFTFSFFLKGLLIDTCTFEGNLDFQSGGHSEKGYPIIIKNNRFSGFVNFFDCWYKSEVFITNNNFLKGTNIQSTNQLLTFDIQPVMSDNVGLTDVEAEF
jgi:hypothetical protein